MPRLQGGPAEEKNENQNTTTDQNRGSRNVPADGSPLRSIRGSNTTTNPGFSRGTRPTPDAAAKIATLEKAVATAQTAGDNAWMLTSAALVLMMTGPGLALFYGGLVRRKNVLGTMMHSFVMMALITRHLGHCSATAWRSAKATPFIGSFRSSLS